MILFAEPPLAPIAQVTPVPATPPSQEAIAQLAMAGDSVQLAPPPVSYSVVQPWVSIDIETTNARPEEVERHLRLHFFPPSNYKTAEACGKALLDMREKKAAKSALLDSAPVVIVTVQMPVGLFALHCLGAAPLEPHAATGGSTQGFATAREMLIALRTGLDLYVGEETTIVGHNIEGFDLPKLRWAYVRAGLRMPYALAAKSQPVFDTMRQYGRRFSQVEKPFVALSDLLDEFGLPNHKSEIDGSKVPGMVEEIQAGKRELLAPLLTYALKDAAIEARLYLAMTGQLEDVLTPSEAAGA